MSTPFKRQVAAEQPRGEFRVLMLAFLFPPTAAVGGFRTLRFAKYLPAFGWQPIVVTPTPERISLGVDATLVDAVPDELIIERTSIHYDFRLFTHLAKRVGFGLARSGPSQGGNGRPGTHGDLAAHDRGRGLSRLARNVRDFIFFTPDPHIAWKGPALRAAKNLIREFAPQVIYSTGPPHSTHLIAARLKQLVKLPWAADFRDPWASVPWKPGPYNPWGQARSHKLEAHCVRCADAVILNTQRLRDDFLQRYPDQPVEKFSSIPNGYDPQLRGAVEVMLGQAAASGRSPAIRICHAGSLYGRRDPRPFLLALKQLVDQGANIVFEQIGHVELDFALDRFVQEHGLNDRVEIFGPVPHHEALRRMAAADLLLIIQPDTQVQVPGKLFEMITFRKPLVAVTGGGETAEIIQRFELGAIARSNEVEEIARTIRSAAARIDGSRDWGNGALASYDGRDLTGSLACLLTALVADRDNQSREVNRGSTAEPSRECLV